jgi:hypothetical protein
VIRLRCHFDFRFVLWLDIQSCGGGVSRGVLENMTNVWEMIGTFPTDADIPWKYQPDESLSCSVVQSRFVRWKCDFPLTPFLGGSG